MASSFGSTEFRVMAKETGYYPLPERDGDGLPHYRATIRADSATDYKALADAACLVTPVRALGSLAFVLRVDAGPGSATLEVPVEAGTLGTFTAVLVGFVPRAHGRDATDFRADCDWALLTDVTP